MKKLTNLAVFVLAVAFLAFYTAGCALTKPKETAGKGNFQVVKVNRFLKMQVLRDETFDDLGRKHPKHMEFQTNVIPYDDRGEEIVVIWRYDGPAIQDAPVKLYFDYNYKMKDEVFRVEESYKTVVPGRYVFRFRNVGDFYNTNGEIQDWRASIYYNGEKVSEKKSAFFKSEK